MANSDAREKVRELVQIRLHFLKYVLIFVVAVLGAANAHAHDFEVFSGQSASLVCQNQVDLSEIINNIQVFYLYLLHADLAR